MSGAPRAGLPSWHRLGSNSAKLMHKRTVTRVRMRDRQTQSVRRIWPRQAGKMEQAFHHFLHLCFGRFAMTRYRLLHL